MPVSARSSPLNSLFVIADAAALIADLGDEADLLDGRVRARARKHVADLSDSLFLRRPVEVFAKRLPGFVLESSYIRTDEVLRCSCVDLPVSAVEAEWIQVSVLKAALAVVEHRKRLGLVCLHSDNRLFEHGLGLTGSAELPCLLRS